MTNDNQKRHLRGAPASMGGKFAPDEKADSGRSIAAEKCWEDMNLDERLHKFSQDNMWYQSYYHSFDDNFDDNDFYDDEIDEYLAGDDTNLFDKIDDYTAEGISNQIHDDVYGYIEDNGGFDDPDDEKEFFEAARDRLYEIDGYDPMEGVYATKAFLRSGIKGFNTSTASSGKSFLDDNEVAMRVDHIKSVLSDNGLDASREDIEELVENGPEYWNAGTTLDVFWHGSVKDAALKGEDASKKIQMNGVHIVLSNTGEGSGHEISIKGDHEITLDSENPARLDRNVDGYGWDETCGLVQGPYRTVNSVTDID